jgi:acyl dehydratase
MTDNNEV